MIFIQHFIGSFLILLPFLLVVAAITWAEGIRAMLLALLTVIAVMTCLAVGCILLFGHL